MDGGKRQYLGLDGGYHEVNRAAGVLLLEDVKLVSKPVLKNGSAALWDIGDGVACFEFTSKSNALDDKIIELLGQAIEVVGARFKALVIYNEGSNFSLGANLGLMLFAANIAAWGEIEKLVAAGQKTYKALKYAPFPVVAAPAGMALGGGCEIVLHADAVQAHAETYLGLVECGVGLHSRLGRLRRDAGALASGTQAAARPDAGAGESVRGDQHRGRFEVGASGDGEEVPAPDRRHQHEPRSSAGGCEAAGAVAGRGLRAAEAAGISFCRARPGAPG